MISFLLVVKQKQAKLITLFKRWAIGSAWAYPALLLVLFCGLVGLKISGSSVGVYNQFTSGVNAPDPDLLYGSPKNVRADEWQGTTQLIISQSKTGFHKVNPNVGQGADLALNTGVPYKDWSAVFRPHTWAFFFLGVESAFAYSWWLPLFMMMLGAYFLALRLLPGQKAASILFSLAAGASPFLLWWYQVAAFGTIAYGFFALILLHRIFEDEPLPLIKTRRLAPLIYIGGLAYVITCMALLLYPPFQIPVALGVVFYGVGYLLQKLLQDKVPFIVMLKKLGLVATGLALAGMVAFAFIHTNHAAVNAQSGSLYPGKRVTHSGEVPLLHAINGYMMPLQQKGVVLFRNLSESSNFILLLPFLLVPGFALMAYEYKKTKRTDWTFLFVQLCGLMFLLRAVVPVGNHLYKFLLLNKVPGNRLIIGLGFVGFLQLLLFARKMAELELSKVSRLKLSAVFGSLTFASLVVASIYAKHHYGGLGRQRLSLVVLAAAFSLIIYLLFAKRAIWAMTVLLGFSVVSGFRVMPLYHGLGFLTHGQLIQAMQKVSKSGDRWATLNTIEYENIALAAGRTSLGGSQPYPETALWQQVGGPKFSQIYNREGHALFTTESLPADMVYIKPNLFKVRFYCSPFILKNVDYALSTTPLNLNCTHLAETVKYPKTTFYLYKVSN